MNTIIFFLAGVSIGLATDKLYHSLFTSRKHAEAKDKNERRGREKKVRAAEEPAASESIEESKVTGIKEVSTQSVGFSTETGESHDDLSQIKGVGPKLNDALQEVGINSYKELANSSGDSLFEKLRETGGRFTKAAILSVVERAQLAVNEKKNQ